MPVPATNDEFVELVRKSGLIDNELLEAFLKQLAAAPKPPATDPKQLAILMVRNALLTGFHAEQLLQGKWRGFMLGKYQIMERIGSGGMGIVYLCQHKFMHRPVAVKVLPASLANDPWFLKRFYQEAQAVAALDHPNIVRAYDIDQDGTRHFLVMEYVDGSNLQEIVSRHGPIDPLRAAHYIRQAAFGLQHAHQIGLVHRDIKPGNILLSRQGVIKILDMGLARFFLDNQQNANSNRDSMEKMVGTDDYLPPEQVVDSGNVDIRADIYGLGATFYYFLTGHPPFHEVEIAHLKLVAHLTRSPKAIREIRPEVSEDLCVIVERMMAKNPWDRYQVPSEVVQALAPWTETPIDLPPAKEMPRLSPACQRFGIGEGGNLAGIRTGIGESSLVLRQGSNAPGSSILSHTSRSHAPTPTGNTTRTQKPRIVAKEPTQDNHQASSPQREPQSENHDSSAGAEQKSPISSQPDAH